MMYTTGPECIYCFHEMRDANTDKLIATLEQLVVRVDSEIRKVEPMEAETQELLAQACICKAALALNCLCDVPVNLNLDQARIVLGKKSGLSSIKLKLEELGIDMADDQHAVLLAQVKEQGTAAGRLLADDDFRQLARMRS